MKTRLGMALIASLIILTGFLVIPGIIDLSKAQEDRGQDIGYKGNVLVEEGNSTEEALGNETENTSSSNDQTEHEEPTPEDDPVFLDEEEEVVEDLVPVIMDAGKLIEEVKPTGKIAYLTFDDGPSEVVTPQILEILDRYGIRATFFVLGKMVDRNPDVLKQTYENGHSIGNHTYSHNYEIIYRKTDNFLDEVYRTEKAIQIATEDSSYVTSLVRLPGGSHAEYKKPTVVALEDEGFRVFDWNALNGDSELDKPTVDYLYGRFKETYKKQDKVVMLMHDTDEKKKTVEALPSIIEHLLLEGYSFKTLEEYDH